MPEKKLDLHIELDRSSPVSLPNQIAQGVREAVAEGIAAPHDRLPSTRTLAAQLGVSRGTVETAFAQLQVEGFVVSRSRGASHIDPDLPAAALRSQPRPPRRRPGGPETADPGPGGPRITVDLRPGAGGRPITDDPKFRTAWRAALDAPHSEPDPRGEVALRNAIADHLRIMRGLVVEPDDIVVTGGSREGLSLVLDALDTRKRGQVEASRTGHPSAGKDEHHAASATRPGVRIAVEEPGFPGLRKTLSRAEVVHVPVDAEGFDVTAMSGRAPVDAALVTPNHQFPYGSSMPAERRTALATWARESGVLLIEDDYDSEARYLGPVAPPLYSQAAIGTVAHLGTFSTVLTREAATGYVLADGTTGEAIRRIRDLRGPAVPALMQRAVANYLDMGGLRSRITQGRRRMRRASAVIDEFAGIPGFKRHERVVMIELPAGSTPQVIAEAARAGIAVADLESGWSDLPHGHDRHGLVLAYSNPDPAALRRALDTLRRIIERAG